jgi:hypothetical protein
MLKPLLKQGAIRLPMAFQDVHFVDFGYFSNYIHVVALIVLLAFSHSCIATRRGFAQ